MRSIHYQENFNRELGSRKITVHSSLIRKQITGKLILSFTQKNTDRERERERERKRKKKQLYKICSLYLIIESNSVNQSTYIYLFIYDKPLTLNCIDNIDNSFFINNFETAYSSISGINTIFAMLHRIAIYNTKERKT